MLAAITGGKGAGALAAVVATLSFDFFHTQPYLRLTIASADDVETTLLLLIVGLAVGQLVAHAAALGEATAARRSDVARLRRVADATARGDDPVDVLLTVEAELTELFDLAACRFESPPGKGVGARLERGGTLVAARFRFESEHGEFSLPLDGASSWPWSAAACNSVGSCSSPGRGRRRRSSSGSSPSPSPIRSG